MAMNSVANIFPVIRLLSLLEHKKMANSFVALHLSLAKITSGIFVKHWQISLKWSGKNPVIS